MRVWRSRSLTNKQHTLGILPSWRRKKHASDNLSEAIRNLFGYQPRNIPVYELAFRHKSLAIVDNGVKHCNERLEYLGDAVLGSVVADFLFKKFPFKDEGFLTEMRSRIVSRSNLNMLSRKLGLDHLVKATKESSAPGSSILGDAFEAFVGAMYLDKGYAFTKNLIIQQIIQTHLDVDELMSRDINFKSKVIEWAQRKKRGVDFVLADEFENGRKGRTYVIELRLDNQVVGRGQDYSIKRAEQRAARAAWEEFIDDGESGDQ